MAAQSEPVALSQVHPICVRAEVGQRDIAKRESQLLGIGGSDTNRQAIEDRAVERVVLVQ